MNVVQPPRRIHARRFRVRLLLPIEPPEIDAALFQWMVQEVHVIGRKFFVGDVEGHVLLRRRINAHPPRHLCVSIFPRLYAGGRMQIQSGLQSFGSNLPQESVRIGEEKLVPAIS